MNPGQILVVPACEPGRGGGHLCRCIALTGDLRAAGKEAWLFTGADNADADTSSLLKSMNFNPAWRVKEDGLNRVCAKKIECIILDRFQTPPEELSRWKNIAPVVGIDEGGPCRDSFDFLIDILTPEKFGRPPANIACPSLLKFPKKPLSKKSAENDSLKVLVTFGQEDTAELGSSVARAISTAGAKNMEITWLRGSLSKPLSSKEVESFPNVRVEQSIPSLAEHLGEYDIVITHYGITAYEALFAGTPVLLASPTAYHKKLAKTAGFKIFSSNSKFFDKKKLTELKNHCEALAVRYKLREGCDLASLFCELSPAVNRHCPVCGANTPTNSVSRFSERTYRRCKNCGVVYMDRTCPAPFEYEREYFFEAYAKQYGKTYLEDFPNIKAAGIRRVKIIKSLLPKTIAPKNTDSAPRSLLDIGCAYGPFLDAAREEGFSPFGIDPALDAVRYVKQELKIQAVHGFFPNCQLPSPAPFGAVTLWYVIEHFTDCAAVLSQVKKILKPGGILAFSTPSFSGVSGRKSLVRFLSASPADHWTVWSPAMCKKALAPFGFKVKKITVSGHHPERFPLFGKFAKSKKSPLYRPLLAVSKFFRLGDTFEVYAECI